jgi:hypothetical protein
MLAVVDISPASAAASSADPQLLPLPVVGSASPSVFGVVSASLPDVVATPVPVEGPAYRTVICARAERPS